MLLGQSSPGRFGGKAMLHWNRALALRRLGSYAVLRLRYLPCAMLALGPAARVRFDPLDTICGATNRIGTGSWPSVLIFARMKKKIFRRLTLFEVLQLLPLIFENMWLQMQARNIAVTDPDLNRMEDQLLGLYLEREHTPVPEIFVVSAWSQMWIFAFFELIRTWKSHADCMLRFIRKLQRIAPDKRLEAIDDEERRLNLAPRTLSPGTFYVHVLRRYVADLQAAEQEFATAIKLINPHRQILAEVRTSLGKHQVPDSGAFAPTPGYGRISYGSGSLSWRVVYKDNSEAFISRRAIADMWRMIGLRLGRDSGTAGSDPLSTQPKDPKPAS